MTDRRGWITITAQLVVLIDISLIAEGINNYIVTGNFTILGIYFHNSLAPVLKFRGQNSA
jgi:hypothetical protein